mmetsp:Transcript_76853/g.212895  ORF Transcript_76853/g.212895 Transcript_76853/m.212895 type:complete len:323 (+) Transcript_76853:76-1044(+)
MQKYRKVIKQRDAVVQDDDEIRVTSAGSVSAYISRAAKLFNEMDKTSLKITATGNALTKAVSSAEVIKRRFKGLHQITTLSSLEIVDEYEPIEEGLDPVTEARNLPTMVIKLSKEALDKDDPGYQEPLDEALVEEVDPEEMMKARGRGKGLGRGRGLGRGKGLAKGGKGAKGEGKGKASKGEGKGKGYGKYDDEPKGKSKGKGKDKGYSKGYSSWDEPPRSKGKGKSKGWDDYGSSSYGGYGGSSYGSKDKGGGKSKGKGWEDRSYGGYGGGYSSSYDRGYGGYSPGYSKGYDSYADKGKSKGKGKSLGKGKGSWGYSGGSW